MYIETPEKYFRDNERQLDRIVNLIASLEEELQDIKKQLQREKKRSQVRKLRDREQQLENELNQARQDEEELIGGKD